MTSRPVSRRSLGSVSVSSVLAAAEEPLEHQVEVGRDGVECLGEHASGVGVDLADGGVDLVAGFLEIGALRGQEVPSLLDSLVFGDRARVDRPHFLDLATQPGDLGGRAALDLDVFRPVHRLLHA